MKKKIESSSKKKEKETHQLHVMCDSETDHLKRTSLRQVTKPE